MQQAYDRRILHGFHAAEQPVPKELLSQFVPDLLLRVELRRIGRQKAQFHVFGHPQCLGCVPPSPVHEHQDMLFRMPPTHFAQKAGHGSGVGVRQDQAVMHAVSGADGTKDVRVLPDRLLAYHGPHGLWCPTGPGRVDPPESCLVLEHDPQRHAFRVRYCFRPRFPFCEAPFLKASIASLLCFGCLGRGATFLHSCRFSIL